MNGLTVEKLYNYSSFSRSYDLFIGSLLHGGRQVAVESLQLSPGEHILEIGTGTALMASHYPKHCRVTGIDLSETMLRTGKKRIARHGLKNFEVVRMDAMHLAFADGQFDKILAAYFLTVVRDPLAAIAEMKRVCRPGGYLIFINHFMNRNPVLARCEKLISPFSCCLGFRTDVCYETLMEKSQLIINRVISVPPTGMVKVVCCFNP